MESSMTKNSKLPRLARGACVTEAALALPVLLVFCMSFFDLTRSISEQVIIREAQYEAARHGAIQSKACLDSAKEQFLKELSQRGLGTRQVNFEGSGSLEVNGIRGLNLRVQVESSCSLCGVYSALKAKLAYSAGTFYPYEIANCV